MWGEDAAREDVGLLWEWEPRPDPLHTYTYTIPYLRTFPPLE